MLCLVAVAVLLITINIANPVVVRFQVQIKNVTDGKPVVYKADGEARVAWPRGAALGSPGMPRAAGHVVMVATGRGYGD